MIEIDKIIEDGERVFWQGKPKFWPFFLSGFGGVLFGLVFLIAGGFFVVQGIRQ